MYRYSAIFDSSFRFVYCNHLMPAIAAAGGTMEAMLGTRPWDMVPDDKIDQTRDLCKLVHATGLTSHSFVWSPCHAYGPRLYFQVFRQIGGAEASIFGTLYEFPQGLASLTKAERETLYHFGAGLSAKQIGKITDNAESTVRTLLTRARKKMSELTSTSCLLLMAHNMRSALTDANRTTDYSFAPAHTFYREPWPRIADTESGEVA